MRTTIDLPDDLYRRIKARAAMRGLKLKEYVTMALRDSLFERSTGEVREATAEYVAESSKLAEDCVLPLVSGQTTETLRAIDEARIDQILESDERDVEPPAG